MWNSTPQKLTPKVILPIIVWLSFSSVALLNKFKPKLNKGEMIYVFTKKELLTFLDLNKKLAAAVVNPMVDDLLLHRLLLQNLITVQEDQTKFS